MDERAKKHVVTWKRAGHGCQRAKNRCRYLETCRTWVRTCKKPMSLPGNVQDLGANVQKTDVVTWKRAGLGCQRAKNHVVYWKRAGLGCQRAIKRLSFLVTSRTWMRTCPI